MADVEEPEEPTFRPRRSPDENAQAAWHQVQCVLTMLEDMVEAGAIIRLPKSPIFDNAGNVALVRQATFRQIERVLRTAEVVDD